MIDETETIRREMVATINAEPGRRPDLKPNTVRSGTRASCPRTSRYWASPLRFVVVGGGRTACEDRLMFQHQPTILLGSAPSDRNDGGGSVEDDIRRTAIYNRCRTKNAGVAKN